MTKLRVTSSRPVAPAAEIAVCVGDAGRTRHAWFAPADGQVETGGESEVPEDVLFPCRPGASDEEMLGLLAHWPSWRMTQLARLELGSRVLVVGDTWLAPRVLEFARLWGCLWRAACGSANLRGAADFWTERGDAETLRRILPAGPDAAILLGTQEAIAPALAVCQDKGAVVLAVSGGPKIDLNLYPDVHRRGLRVVGCEPLTRHALTDAEIRHGFDRIGALTAANAFARG